MNSLKTCLLLAGGASVALAAPGGGLRLATRDFSNTTKTCPYTVEIDDNCYFIAKNRFGIEPTQFSKLNGGKFDSTCEIFPDNEVRVPCEGQLKVDEVDVSGECLHERKIEAGETCSSISRKHNIAAHVLQAYNKLDRKCSIKADDNICVSTKKSPNVCTKNHTVISGDNCYDLATKNKVTVLDLKEWNPDLINDRCAIRPDHVVCVAAEPAQPETTSTSAVASSTAIQTSSVVSQSTFQTVVPTSATPVVPTAAPAADANAVPIGQLSVEAKLRIESHFLRYVGNVTVVLPSRGDNKVLQPSQAQLNSAIKAIASVSANNREAPASGAVAPSLHLSTSVSVLVHILNTIEAKFDYSGCSAGKCIVIITSPAPPAANVAANAAVSLRVGGSEGDRAAPSRPKDASQQQAGVPQSANRISTSVESSVEFNAGYCT